MKHCVMKSRIKGSRIVRGVQKYAKLECTMGTTTTGAEESTCVYIYAVRIGEHAARPY